MIVLIYILSVATSALMLGVCIAGYVQTRVTKSEARSKALLGDRSTLHSWKLRHERFVHVRFWPLCLSTTASITALLAATISAIDSSLAPANFDFAMFFWLIVSFVYVGTLRNIMDKHQQCIDSLEYYIWAIDRKNSLSGQQINS